MKILYTHGGQFYTAEIIGLAVLSLLYSEVEIVRSDECRSKPDNAISVNIGREYNPKLGIYDHHQDGGAGVWPDGTPCSSAGLIWKQFGAMLLTVLFPELNEEERHNVDTLFITEVIKPIDQANTSVNQHTELSFVGSINALNAISETIRRDANGNFICDSRSNRQEFDIAVAMATSMIVGQLHRINNMLLATPLFASAPCIGGVKVLPCPVPWRPLAAKIPELNYVVQHNPRDNEWVAMAVPIGLGNRNLRKPFPSNWCGKARQPLVEATGVSGAIFCHRNGYFIAAESKSAIIELARMADTM